MAPKHSALPLKPAEGQLFLCVALCLVAGPFATFYFALARKTSLSQNILFVLFWGFFAKHFVVSASSTIPPSSTPYPVCLILPLIPLPGTAILPFHLAPLCPSAGTQPSPSEVPWGQERGVPRPPSWRLVPSHREQLLGFLSPRCHRPKPGQGQLQQSRDPKRTLFRSGICLCRHHRNLLGGRAAGQGSMEVGLGSSHCHRWLHSPTLSWSRSIYHLR